MGLQISTIGSDSGLMWEQNLNSSLNTVDFHNHSPGSGVQITPQGMNISSNLNFQNNSASNIYGLMFSSSGASVATGLLYTAPSSGGGINDLFYNDFAGNVIQLTKAGIVNAIASSIPGESYSGGTFTWVQGDGSTTPANFDIGSVTIRPNTAGTTNGINIQTPSGISSSYALVMPSLPPAQQIMTLDNSGNITAPYTADNSTIAISSNQLIVKSGGITTTQISATAGILGSQLSASAGIVGTQLANNTITRNQEAAVGQQVSASCGSFSTTSATTVDVTNLTVTITTTGRPVMVFLQPAIGQPGSLYSDAGATYTIVKTLVSTPTVLGLFTVSGTVAGPIVRYPVSTILYLDTSVVGAANTYTYKVTAQRTGGTSSAVVQVVDAVLVAYEL